MFFHVFKIFVIAKILRCCIYRFETWTAKMTACFCCCKILFAPLLYVVYRNKAIRRTQSENKAIMLSPLCDPYDSFISNIIPILMPVFPANVWACKPYWDGILWFEASLEKVSCHMLRCLKPCRVAEVYSFCKTIWITMRWEVKAFLAKNANNILPTPAFISFQQWFLNCWKCQYSTHRPHCNNAFLTPEIHHIISKPL